MRSLEDLFDLTKRTGNEAGQVKATPPQCGAFPRSIAAACPTLLRGFVLALVIAVPLLTGFS